MSSTIAMSPRDYHHTAGSKHHHSKGQNESVGVDNIQHRLESKLRTLQSADGGAATTDLHKHAEQLVARKFAELHRQLDAQQARLVEAIRAKVARTEAQCSSLLEELERHRATYRSMAKPAAVHESEDQDQQDHHSVKHSAEDLLAVEANVDRVLARIGQIYGHSLAQSFELETDHISQSIGTLAFREPVNPLCWDAQNCNENLTISADGLELTCDSSLNWPTCRASTCLTVLDGEQHYWEVVHAADNPFIGVATADHSLEKAVGCTAHSWGINCATGEKYHNGTGYAYYKNGRINPNDKVGLLLDCRAGTLTFFVNGENLGTAFTGLQDLCLYPAVSLDDVRCTVPAILDLDLMEPAQFVPLKHLLKASSRKVVEELVVAAYRARDERPLPARLVDASASALQIPADHAAQLVESVCELIKAALYEAVSAEDVAELFPSGFHSNLAKLLSTILAHHLPAWRRDLMGGTNMLSLPRLSEIDWRIDVKSASERGRMNVPTILVQLKVEKTPTRVDEEREKENVTFELDKATIETMLEGLGRIRDQLNTISSQ